MIRLDLGGKASAPPSGPCHRAVIRNPANKPSAKGGDAVGSGSETNRRRQDADTRPTAKHGQK